MKLLQFLSVITEKSARDRYMLMFNQLYKAKDDAGAQVYQAPTRRQEPWPSATNWEGDNQPFTSDRHPHTIDGETPISEIKWAVENLGREDRIVWYLRQAREAMNLMHAGQMGGQGALRRLKRALLHSLGLPIQKIQEYRFGWDDPDTVLNYFHDLEDEFKKQKKDGTPLQENPEHDVFLRFADGTVWWDLNTGRCSEEADAMGHCGNRGQVTGDKILSLRKPRPVGNQTWWVPCLTFIYNTQTGKLGEMKGRGNDKPVAAYHKYIIPLLKDARIKGIAGGGYKPENNFRLSDLPQAEQDKLIEEKPSLADVLYRYTKFGMSKELADDAIAQLDNTSFGVEAYLPEVKGFLVDIFDTARAFVAEHVKIRNRQSESTLKWVLDILEGDGHDQADYAAGVDNHMCEVMLLRLTPAQMETIGEHIAKENDLTEEELEDIDFTDHRDLFRLIDEHDDEIKNHLERAVETGMRIGAENEMSEYVSSYFKRGLTLAAEETAEGFDLNFSLVNLKITREPPTPNRKKGKPSGYEVVQQEHFAHWDECGLVVNEKDLLGLISNYSDDGYGWNTIAQFKDLEEPYHGFSGYDKDAAQEELLELLDDILREKATARRLPKKVE